jgi:hypothetical protein
VIQVHPVLALAVAEMIWYFSALQFRKVIELLGVCVARTFRLQWWDAYHGLHPGGRHHLHSLLLRLLLEMEETQR